MDSIPNEVFDVLEEEDLIRREERSGAQWYELTHDRLIKPVVDSNKEWREKEELKAVKRRIRRRQLKIISPIIISVVVVTGLIMYLHPELSINACIVGSSPIAVDFNPNTNTIYVANKGSNSVSVIGQDCKKGVQNIVVGKDPLDLAVNPNSNTIYVANSGDNTVSVIDGKTNAVVKTVQVGHVPDDVAVNPNTNTVYVVNKDSNSVSVIDGKTNAVVQTVQVGNEPVALTINRITNSWYVANSPNNSISILAQSGGVK
jgi:YVTN family beta-propeller protein